MTNNRISHRLSVEKFKIWMKIYGCLIFLFVTIVVSAYYFPASGWWYLLLFLIFWIIASGLSWTLKLDLFFNYNLKFKKSHNVNISQISDHQLLTTIKSLTKKAGLSRVPEVKIVPIKLPYIGASYKDGGSIFITYPILKLFNPETLETLLAHEIAHLKHRDNMLSWISTRLSYLACVSLASLGITKYYPLIWHIARAYILNPQYEIILKNQHPAFQVLIVIGFACALTVVLLFPFIYVINSFPLLVE